MAIEGYPAELLFQRMSDSIMTTILPRVADDSARSELTALAEVLGNLASRMTWDQQLIAASTTESRVLADRLGAPAGDTGQADDLIAQRARVGTAVDALFADPSGVLDQTAADAVMQLAEAEFQRWLASAKTLRVPEPTVEQKQ